MEDLFIYFRNWTGFTGAFPYVEALNALDDRALARELDAHALAWLRENKAVVRTRYRQIKQRLAKGIRTLAAGATDRARGSSSTPTRPRSFQSIALRHLRLERPRPLIERVGHIAGWYNADSISGVASPSPMLFLGRVRNESLARDLILAMSTLYRRPDEPLRLCFGAMGCAQLGVAEVARIELQLEELAQGDGDAGAFHRNVLKAFERLCSKLPDSERAAVSVTAVPSKAEPPGKYAEFPTDIARLARAKARLSATLTEMEERLREANGDLSSCIAMWGGPSNEAAEMAAILGFDRAPVEFTVHHRGKSRHELFNEYPEFTHVHGLRLHDPTGSWSTELAIGANAAPSSEARPIVELPQDPVKKARIFESLRSWLRVVNGLAIETVRYSYPPQQQMRSMQQFIFLGQLLRELKGMGDSTPDEQRKRQMETQQEFNAAGFDPEKLLRSESAKYRLAATLAHAPQQETKPPERQEYIFQPDGDGWRVRFGGKECRFQDKKGLRIIYRLLRIPETPVPALELQGLDFQLSKSEQSPQETSDRQALAEYRDRLREVEAEIDEARRNNDDAGLRTLEQEKRELLAATRAVFGGKARPLGPATPSEKARLAVRQNLDRSYTALRTAKTPMPELADHLARSIHCEGSAYAYRPSAPLAWDLG